MMTLAEMKEFAKELKKVGYYKKSTKPEIIRIWMNSPLVLEQDIKGYEAMKKRGLA